MRFCEIRGAEDMALLVENVGFLPFFASHIPDFFVEACCLRKRERRRSFMLRRPWQTCFLTLLPLIWALFSQFMKKVRKTSCALRY